MDELLIRAEYAHTHHDDEAQQRLQATMREQLRASLGVHPIIELVPEGSMKRTDFKARRVIDDRDLYRTSLSDRHDANDSDQG